MRQGDIDDAGIGEQADVPPHVRGAVAQVEAALDAMQEGGLAALTRRLQIRARADDPVELALPVESRQIRFDRSELVAESTEVAVLRPSFGPLAEVELGEGLVQHRENEAHVPAP